MPKETLRNCPVCSTKLTEKLIEKMGVRHYQAMDAMLPGKVRGADIDYVLQSEKGAIALLLEFKPSKSRLAQGQMMFLRHFRRRGDHVWIVSDRNYKKAGTVDVGIMDPDGMVRDWHNDLTIDQLGDKLCAWWSWAAQKGTA